MKVYHIKIDGYVEEDVVNNFKNRDSITLTNQNFNQFIAALSENCTITKTMHEVPDELILSKRAADVRRNNRKRRE